MSYFSMFDELIEGIQVIDSDWKYIYVNKAAALQGKTTRENLLERTMMECYPGIEKTKMFLCLAQCFSDGKPSELLHEFTFQDGTTAWFELRLRKTEFGVILMSFDVTNEKILEEGIDDLHEDLEKTIKRRTEELNNYLKRERKLNEVKSAFISMAAHEFRNPLAAIMGSINLAKKYGMMQDYEKQERQLKRISNSVAYLNNVLGDFLSLSYLEAGTSSYHPQKTPLRSFVDLLLGDVQPLLKEGQEIYCNLPKDNLAYIDPNAFRIIITNLLTNAIKYSSIKTVIKLDIEKSEEHLKISVADAGIGIPEKDKEYLFNRFYRAGNVKGEKGTGLGLSIVKSYVDLAGGEITFESETALGSTFYVKIPQ